MGKEPNRMKNIWSQISWLRTAVAAVLGLLAGSLLIFIAIQLPNTWYGTLILNLGSVVIASVALVLIFDYWQKDALFREFFRYAKSAEQIKAARISGFSSTFQDQIPWEDLFAKSTYLDVVFAYGSTWRGAHGHRIDAMLAKDRAHLGIILPDPDNDAVVHDLAARFKIDTKILESLAFFRAKRTAFPGKVSMFVTTKPLTHTFYRFNNEAVLAMYRYKENRGGVPTFLADRGGELYEFVRSEWYSLTEEGVTSGSVRPVE
jgi:hypothetical protein